MTQETTWTALEVKVEPAGREPFLRSRGGMTPSVTNSQHGPPDSTFR